MTRRIEVTPDQRWDRYVDASGLLDKIGENQKAEKEGRPEDRAKATKFLRKTVYDSIPEDRRPANVDNMNQDEYKANYNVVLGTNDEKAAENFGAALGNLENIPGAKKALEEIAGTKEILERVSQDDRGIVENLASWKGLERLAKKYESGKMISGEERKVIQSAGAEGFAEDEVKRTKKAYEKNGEKYSEAIYSAIKVASQVGVQSGRIKEDKLKPFIKSGLDNLKKKAKKEYEGALGEDKDRIYKIIGNAVKTWAGESAEEFGRAEDSMYRASQGKLYK
ncbi:hypothetical protein AUJ84_02925 [Candidatus Pacearchaeota archaeon CG1_02_32_132]|nr:MAG: hypothetical protein AUJ84_02925 [Candidatus Pacearchaeota archaeon CG1_02_32_132]